MSGDPRAELDRVLYGGCDAELASTLLDLAGPDMQIYRARCAVSRGGFAVRVRSGKLYIDLVAKGDTPGGIRCVWCGAEFPYGANRAEEDRTEFYRAHSAGDRHKAELDRAARDLAVFEIRARVGESRAVPVLTDESAGILVEDPGGA